MAGNAQDRHGCGPGGDGFVRHAGDDAPFGIMRAFRCAREGIAYAFRSQRNLKIHAAIAALAVALGFALGVSEAAWLAIVLSIVVVMALEVANTAIESIVDLASPDWAPLAKHAKDCAAGAVYLAAAGSLIVAAIVYLPRIAALFQ